MTTDEAIAYLDSEAASNTTLAEGVERWGKSAGTIRARAAKLKACADALRNERALLATALMPHPREGRP